MSRFSQAREGFAEGTTGDRPDFVKDEHLEFLDELRESGVCNMFGARPYLADEFEELNQKQSAAVLAYWMKTFPRK